jgi:hypothetical protein
MTETTGIVSSDDTAGTDPVVLRDVTRPAARPAYPGPLPASPFEMRRARVRSEVNPSKGAGQQSLCDGIRNSDRRVGAAYTYRGSGGESRTAHIILGVSVTTISTILWKKFQAATVPAGVLVSVKNVDAVRVCAPVGRGWRRRYGIGLSIFRRGSEI